MNKTTFALFLTLLACSALFAQNNSPITSGRTYPSFTPEAQPVRNGNEPIASPDATGDTIWSEDFAGGLPAGWKSVDLTANDFKWKYTTDPVVHCTYTNITFQSSTSDNGFMLLFGDKYNSDASCTNTISGTFMDAFIQTPAIDLSGYTSLQLNFQQAFRYCCSSIYSHLSVFVSNDSINWTEFDVTDGIGANVASSIPVYKSINITAVAANQPKVFFRFHQYGAAHYYWCMDDIAITEAPHDDLRLLEGKFNINGSDNIYTHIPMQQAAGYAMNFSGHVYNYGNKTQTGAILNVQVKKDSGSVVYNESTSPVTIPYLTYDTLPLAVAYPISTTGNCIEMGDYKILFAVSQNETDEVPENNADTLNYTLTDSVYAKDHGVPYGKVAPKDFTCCTHDNAQIASVFTPVVADTATSISVFISGSSSPSGITLIMHLYPFTGSPAHVAPVPIASSAVHDLTSLELNKWLTLPFMSAARLMKDTSYLASIQIKGVDKGYNVYFGKDEAKAADSTVFVYNNSSWYFINEQPMIRLNTNGSGCVDRCPTLQLTSTPDSCGTFRGSVNANVTGGFGPFHYQWSNGATTKHAQAEAGINTVTVTDLGGSCMLIDSVMVGGYPDTLDLGDDIKVCPDNINPVILDAGPGYTSYTWSTGSTTQTETIQALGSYSVMVTNAVGCAYRDTMVMKSSGPELGPDTTICLADSILLDAGPGYTSYLWSTGATTQAIYTVHDKNLYIVNATDSNGCATSDSILVDQIPSYIYGTIWTSDGKPLMYSNIDLFIMDSDTNVYKLDSTVTDSLGKYRIPLPPFTQVWFRAFPDSARYPLEMPTYYDDTTLVIGNSSDIFTTGCTPRNISYYTIHGKNPGGSKRIGGYVTEGTNKHATTPTPVAGLALILKDKNNKKIGYQITDANGHFSFGNLVTDTYVIWADRWRIPNDNPPVVDLKTSDLNNLEFKLHKTWLELVTVTSTVKSDLPEGEDVQLYPVPSDGRIVISNGSGLPETGRLRVYDVTGRQVYDQAFVTRQPIDLSALPAGYYTASIILGDRVITRRMVMHKLADVRK
ncbi:MAG: T9SS type A sorting domain-containing protein [Flavobacteriales bacterium]|nr:T9SS type A sorting domain-containing protein [Flavobacteriales bacterium]MCB9447464.1 T9SS type A sorting domain-containing protein [Flavobacteriales bacterium]